MSSSITQGAFTHSLRTSLQLRKEFTCLNFSVYSVSELQKQSVRFTVCVKRSLLVMWRETNMLVTCIRAAGSSGCWHAQTLLHLPGHMLNCQPVREMYLLQHNLQSVAFWSAAVGDCLTSLASHWAPPLDRAASLES